MKLDAQLTADPIRRWKWLGGCPFGTRLPSPVDAALPYLWNRGEVLLRPKLDQNEQISHGPLDFAERMKALGRVPGILR